MEQWRIFGRYRALLKRLGAEDAEGIAVWASRTLQKSPPLTWKRLGPAFGLYSAATLVIVLWAPSKGFPLVSLPRLLMDDFPIVLALVAVTRDRHRDFVLIGLAALCAVAGVAFAHGVWVA